MKPRYPIITSLIALTLLLSFSAPSFPQDSRDPNELIKEGDKFYKEGNYEEAVSIGLLSVGRPVIVTSVILSLSFLVYLVSDMEVLASFGILLSMTIISALLADLFLLPALVLTFRPFGAERQPALPHPEATMARNP